MKITSTLLFFILFACNLNKRKETYAKPPLEEINMPDKFVDVPNSIRTFLIQFTDAMDKNDTTRVIKFINLPLEVYGYEDRDPRVEIKNIIQIFQVLQISLNNESYDVKTDESFKNSIHLKKPFINENINNPKSDTNFSITDFDFKLINRDWKLTRVYIDTKNYNFRLKSKLK
jgi:hypothetical protein